MLNAAKLFEKNTQDMTENVRREPIRLNTFIKKTHVDDEIFVRVGKIKRDSFLELTKSSSGDEMLRDQIRTGKLNVTDLYPNNNHKEDNFKGEIKVGKLNTIVR